MKGKRMREFRLSEEEEEKYNEWYIKHKKKCKLKKKGKQRIETFSFTPTGIGEIKEVKCSCGKSVDLTDVSNW